MTIPKTYTLRQLGELRAKFHKDIEWRSNKRYDDEVVAFLDWLEDEEKNG